MQYIRVIDFEKLQHYRDRTPPWIKLHRSLLEDWRVEELSEPDRWLLIGLQLLASECDNLIPYRPNWIKKRLSIKRTISLKSLIDTKYIQLVEQDASNVKSESFVLASVEHPDIPRALARGEKRREETEERREEEIYIPHGEFGNAKLKAVEHTKLLSMLNGNLDRYIARFDRWIEEQRNPKTGELPKKYQNRKAYLSILNWWERDSATTGANSNGQQRSFGENQTGSQPKIFGAVPPAYTPKQRQPV